MSIWNREYMRGEGGGRGILRWDAVQIIIAINVALFLFSFLVDARAIRGLPIDFVSGNLCTRWSGVVHDYKVWTVLTAAFYHQWLIHLALNMIALFALGRVVEDRLGKREFVTFYLSACVIASLVHVLSGALLDRWNEPMLGASGAIAAVAMVFALWHPETRFLLFFVIPVPAITFVAMFVLIDFAGFFVQGFAGLSQLGHGAHLGGAAFGFAFWHAAQRGFAFRLPRLRLRPRRRRKFRVITRETPPAEDNQELDRILSKISREGLEKLGMSEREFLDKVSRRYRREE